MGLLRAGELDRRITIKRAITAPNEFNEPEETWVDLTTVWAKKTDVSDAERDRAAQVGASRTTRFKIRWSNTVADVDTRDQLLCEGALYQVVGRKELGRREGIELTATALADAP